MAEKDLVTFKEETGRVGKLLNEKYPIIVKRDGTLVQHPTFVLSARDPAAPVALHAYADECVLRKMSEEYVELVRARANEFEAYPRELVQPPATRGFIARGYGDPDTPIPAAISRFVNLVATKPEKWQEMLFLLALSENATKYDISERYYVARSTPASGWQAFLVTGDPKGGIVSHAPLDDQTHDLSGALALVDKAIEQDRANAREKKLRDFESAPSEAKEGVKTVNDLEGRDISMEEWVGEGAGDGHELVDAPVKKPQVP